MIICYSDYCIYSTRWNPVYKDWRPLKLDKLDGRGVYIWYMWDPRGNRVRDRVQVCHRHQAYTYNLYTTKLLVIL